MKTAQEVLDYHTKQCKGTVKTAMIEFAKIHVKAALESAKQIGNDFEGNELMDKAILESYSLNNIK